MTIQVSLADIGRRVAGTAPCHRHLEPPLCEQAWAILDCGSSADVANRPLSCPGNGRKPQGIEGPGGTANEEVVKLAESGED